MTTLKDILLHNKDVEECTGAARPTEEQKVRTDSFATFALDDAVVLDIRANIADEPGEDMK